MGHAGPAGQVPQAERGRPDLLDGLDGGLEQGPREVAVVVGAGVVGSGGSGHAPSLADYLAIDKIRRACLS